MTRPRLFWWLLLVAALAALGFVSNGVGSKDTQVLYHYSTAALSLVSYGVILVVVLAIAGWRTDLLAVRRPASWPRAIGLAVLVFAVAYLLIAAMDPFLHAGREQGLVPKRWESAHAGAYFVNWLVVAGLAPVVEELTYRGLGYSLLERYGKWVAITAVGLLFAASHGLVQAFPELALLGCGLAWLRSRTQSVYPGMLVHGAFNSVALAVVFFHTTR